MSKYRKKPVIIEAFLLNERGLVGEDWFWDAVTRNDIITPVGGKFAVAVYKNDRLCGVAICGRPTARRSDDGVTLEIYRNCTDGTRNACSKLYGACLRIAKNMGYKRVLTYTLASENGASLKASNFAFEGEAGGMAWTGERKRNYYISPEEMKSRWAYYIEGR